MKRLLPVLALAALLGPAPGCSKKEQENRPKPPGALPAAPASARPAPGPEPKRRAAEPAVPALPPEAQPVPSGQREAVQPVAPEVLSGFLPPRLDGLARGEVESRRQIGMLELTADYASDDGAELAVKLTDTGAMRAEVGGRASYTLGLPLDRKTDTGYERHRLFRGLKAHERVEGDQVTWTVLAGDRFILEAQGRGLTPARLESILESLSLEKLGTMKDAGADPPAN